MGSPPIGPSSPPVNPAVVQSTEESNALLAANSMSYIDYLELVGTSKNTAKQAEFDSQAAQSLINKDYFLGVSQDLNNLANVYEATLLYASDNQDLVNNYNASVDGLNGEISTYNSARSGVESAINNLNSAINTINSQNPPTANQITVYDNAVFVYNQYMMNTGNPALSAYQTNSDTTYNQPTAYANTVTIPATNQIITDLNIGIPLVLPLSPATAPVGGSPLPTQPTYANSTLPIPTIDKTPYSSNLTPVSELPPPLSSSDVVTDYFLPYAQTVLGNLSATAKKFAAFDANVALINFFLKQGFNFDPSKVNSFILQTPPPATAVAGGGSPNGVNVSLAIGTDSPGLLGAQSTSLYKAVSAKYDVLVPPHLYDQVNVLAAALLKRLGASAGLSVVQLLGETLKSLPPESPSVEVATAAALLQNTLTAVAQGASTNNQASATSEALLALLKQQVPGISAEQAQELASQLTAAQNISALLFAALNVAVTLKSPNLVENLLNLSLGTLPQTSSPSSTSSSTSSINTSSNLTSLNDVLNNSESLSQIQTDLTNELINQINLSTNSSQPSTTSSDFDQVSSFDNLPPNPFVIPEDEPVSAALSNNDSTTITNTEATTTTSSTTTADNTEATSPTTASNALNNTVASLGSNPTISDFQQTLSQELQKLNISRDQAEYLSLHASVVANQQITPPTTSTNLNSTALAAQIQTNIQNLTAEDLTHPLPTAITNNLVASLTNTSDPHSFTNLLALQVNSLKEHNDTNVNNQIDALRRDFQAPVVDIAAFMQEVRSPAKNIIHSFQTGLMYDSKIPSNWQKPLSIQV